MIIINQSIKISAHSKNNNEKIPYFILIALPNYKRLVYLIYN